jgi:hypothetical protein
MAKIGSEKKVKIVPMIEPVAPVPVKVKDLYLDPMNPRLAQDGFGVDDQVKILSILWRERAVNEIVNSIAASGYWPQEVLFAAREEGKMIVVEGNRRLSAVKLLLSKDLQKQVGASGIPEISNSLRDSLLSLPVVEYSRKALWEYVGFKHVNGPQDWDSIAKAEYIARVHRDFGASLEKIASTIGDDNATVKRLYKGLTVLRQAEEAGVFDRKDSWKKKFPYSHLWTGLGYSGIQAFLGIKPEDWTKQAPVPKGRITQLGELCLWLFGSSSTNTRPMVMSQNPDLRVLDEVLRTKDGYAALRAKLPLMVALNVSRGDKTLLREAMVQADQSLKAALGYIPTGYSGEEDLLERAKGIQALATAIRDSMNSKLLPRVTEGPAARAKKGEGHGN